MSFRFNWPEFDEHFIEKASKELENALNRGKKPSNICDLIRVKELYMGTRPPELDILEIGEVSMDRFRGIFKLAYSGDGFLVLETKVQANPLNFANFTASGDSVTAGPSSPFAPVNPTILAADCPLIVPMQLKISMMKLRAIVVLILSRSTGVTISFKTDPLESVLVSSTFDSLPSVRRHLQYEIENRLRDLFQKELPAMIHSLSNEWLKSNGFPRKEEDSFEIFNSSSPESVSALFPAPNRTLSPPSMAERKNSAPPLKRIRAPRSVCSVPKSPSIAALSAPAEFEIKSPICELMKSNQSFALSFVEAPNDTVNDALVIAPHRGESKYTKVFDFVVGSSRDRIPPTCCSEIGFSTHIDQFYIRSQRSIIVRAPTELALPDPILINARLSFRRKPINIAKLFKSLFRIAEGDFVDGEEGFRGDLGLKAIDEIGSEVIDPGICSVRSGSSRAVIPENFSIRSRTRSLLMGNFINKAFSVSGNRYSQMKKIVGNVFYYPDNSYQSFNSSFCDNVQGFSYNLSIPRHIHHDRFSEADPDMVQFEPDEFRSTDFRETQVVKVEVKSFRAISGLYGDSRGLAVKLGIMRRLHSTIAPNNFSESNILYRTISKGRMSTNSGGNMTKFI